MQIDSPLEIGLVLACVAAGLLMVCLVAATICVCHKKKKEKKKMAERHLHHRAEFYNPTHRPTYDSVQYTSNRQEMHAFDKDQIRFDDNASATDTYVDNTINTCKHNGTLLEQGRCRKDFADDDEVLAYQYYNKCLAESIQHSEVEEHPHFPGSRLVENDDDSTAPPEHHYDQYEARYQYDNYGGHEHEPRFDEKTTA